MINQYYRIGFDTQRVRPKVIVSQYDDGLRKINFELDRTPASATVKIGEQNITTILEDNIVSFIVTSELSVLGEYEGEIVCDGVGTLNFDFIVEETE